MSIYDHCLELNTALPADPSLEETSEELTVQTETAISIVRPRWQRIVAVILSLSIILFFIFYLIYKCAF